MLCLNQKHLSSTFEAKIQSINKIIIKFIQFLSNDTEYGGDDGLPDIEWGQITKLFRDWTC